MATRVIYKYPLVLEGIAGCVIPKGARILTVQTQHENPCVWALVDPDGEDQPVEFRIIGTGHPFHDADSWPAYVGTFQLDQGSLVFHVFARRMEI